MDRRANESDELQDELVDRNVDVDTLTNNGSGIYMPEEEEIEEQQDAEILTLERETGTDLEMGTENDMQELQNTDGFRDPGAGLTLKDSEGEER